MSVDPHSPTQPTPKMTPTTDRKTLFLVGPGLIGSSLLVKLKTTRPDLDLYALTRRQEQANQLSSMGITPIIGSLTDHDLISQWSSRSDIIIHTASADDDIGTSAIIDGIQLRKDHKNRKVIYIQTSGNDELIDSARNFEDTASISDKTIYDTWSNEQLESRLTPMAWHRHVDSILRKRLFNNQSEVEYNVATSIIMPPLIYGIGSNPFNRISIQVPMITRYMMQNGAFTLPLGHDSCWNQVWIHDLVEAYLILIQQLENATPGDVGSNTRPSHYVFPAEDEPFKWKDVFDAVVQQLQDAGHPSASSVHILTGQEDFEERIGGQNNPYSSAFGPLVYGTKNSFTRPAYLRSLGFKHTGKGVVDSIQRAKELDGVIRRGD